MNNIKFKTLQVEDSELNDLTTDKEGNNKIGVGYKLRPSDIDHKCTDKKMCDNGIVVPMHTNDKYKNHWIQDMVDTAKDDKEYLFITITSKEHIGLVMLEKENK